MAHFLSYNTSDSKTGNTPFTANQGPTVIGTLNTEQEGACVGTCKSDQAGTLFVAQSFDGTNFDYVASYPVTANTGIKISESIIAPYVQISYTNGAVGQSFMRLFVRCFGTKTG